MELEIKNYTKVLKGNKVLDNVNLKLKSGIVYGFQGVNGSGKTMLMRAITGLIHPTNGNVTIDNLVIGKDCSFPNSVGLLLENPAFIPSCTAMENLRIIASIKKRIGDKEISETIKKVGLLPEDKRIYKKFSLGMKQKLGIAAAFMENPDLIILDEPLNALDETSVEKVKEMIKEARDRNALVILACHNKLDLEEICDEIVLIEEGKVKEKRKEKNEA